MVADLVLESTASVPVNRGELVRAVQRYQVARMRRTHEALFQSPCYRPLCEFFITDLYSPREIGHSRAATLHSVADVLGSVVPRWVHDGTIGLIDLHALSERLDDRVARVLVSRGVSGELGAQVFESAYLACDDYEDRLRQIELSESSTRFGHRLARHPSVGRLMALAHRLHGLPRLHALLAMLERGFEAFRQADDIDTFVAAMRRGETGYLNDVSARQRG